MLDVCLLGTGGMMPLPYRWLTSLMVRYNGKNILIDCGEGTQIALKEKGWSPNPIDVICFTHYHADHISGLPGMLLTMGNAERTEPLLCIGPKGLRRVVSALRTIAPDLPFEINFHELTEKEESIRLAGDFWLEAFRVAHNVACYGYSVKVSRIGRFSVERAEAANIDKSYWNRLQKGEVVTKEDGTLFTPDMVLGPARKGLHVTYCTDTRPIEAIVKNAKNADLFICEGMYGEYEKQDKAKEYKHMTFYEAARLARAAKVKSLWLTHYSPSLLRPDPFMKAVREIFPPAEAGKDGKTIELLFEES
ncbi:MAG: ribonuclease Z [Lachnospiraceae bacterium]|nr:ribonuclease Z [Lachnospiraceae bacterium]